MSFTMKRNTFREDEVRMQCEELAAWVPRALGREDGEEKADGEAGAAAEGGGSVVDSFIESLQSGVDLCLLVQRVAPASSWPAGEDQPVSDVKIKFNAAAKPGSFQARDNVAKALEACKQLGIADYKMFTTEDLMQRKNDRRVVGLLLDLSRIGAENGVAPPRLVELEREIDEAAADEASDDEETEVLSPEQYGLEQAELDAVVRVFNELTAEDAAITTRADMSRALADDADVERLRGARPGFDALFAGAAEEENDAPVALDEFLAWFRRPDKTAGKGASASRPRGVSLGQRKYTFNYLPYIPRAGDEIDEALAEEVNSKQFDVRIRRIAITRKGKTAMQAYRVGSGSQPKVFMRVVRGLLLVRVGSKWEGVAKYMQGRLAAEYGAA